jgi:alpha-beta hydrolase superfamily lysophospholipase
LGLSEIVKHHEGIVRGLDRPPVLIGHSFGGLVADDQACAARTGFASGAR